MGIRELNERASNAARSAGSDRPPRLRLQDKERAVLRFLANGHDCEEDNGLINWTLYNKVPAPRFGEGRTVDSYCPRSPTTGDESAECDYCTGPNRYPRRRKFGVWCFVRYIDRPASSETSKPIKLRSGKTVHRQTVNNALFWTQGWGQSDYLWNAICDLYDKYCSLDGRYV